MKITLINCRIGSNSAPPFGILYIAAVLQKAGYTMQVLDPEEDNENFINDVVKFRPDIIGISFLTAEYLRARHISSALKKRLPESFIVAGGVHVSSLPEESLKRFDIDAVVIGEGEYTMLELCKKIENRESLLGVLGIFYKSDNKIFKNKPRPPIENLDSLPFLARELIDFEWYLIPPGFIRGKCLKRATTIMASRGCPNLCTFCSAHTVFGYRIRMRSVKNVVGEIEYLIKRYGVDGLRFTDDTLTINHRWISEFCRELRIREIELPWGCNARVNTVNEKMLTEMKGAGCVQLDFGVESGSERILKILKKDITPAQVVKAFSLAQKIGLRRMANFMIGNPTETVEDIQKTYELAKRIKPNFASVWITTPHPGSALYEEAVKEGWVKKTDFSSKWVHNVIDLSPVMNAGLSNKEIIYYRAKLQNLFWRQNYLTYVLNLKFNAIIIYTLIKHPLRTLRGLRVVLKSRNISNFVDTIKDIYRYEMRKS